MKNKLVTLLFILFITIITTSGCVKEKKPGLEQADNIGLLMTGVSSEGNTPNGLSIVAIMKDKEGKIISFEEEIKVYVEIIESTKQQKLLKIIYRNNITVKGSAGLREIIIPFSELDSTVDDPSILPHATNLAIFLPDGRMIGKSEERIHQPYPR